MVWNPNMVAAVAVDENNLAMVFTDIAGESPHSIVISYDARLDQPWGRTDIPREVTGIAANPSSYGSQSIEYVVVSSAGLAYFLSEQGDIDQMQLPEADVPGKRIYGLQAVGSDIFAYGNENQLFLFDQKRWREFTPVIGVDFPDNAEYQVPTWSALDGSGHHELLIVGSVEKHSNYSVLNDPQALSKLSEQEILDAVNQATQPKKPLGIAMQKTKDKWTRVSLPETGPLSAAFFDRQNKQYWLSGTDGQLFSLQSPVADQVRADVLETTGEWIFSLTGFSDKIIVAGDGKLWGYYNGSLEQVRPKIDPAVSPAPAPLRIHGLAKSMVYFDRVHGIKFWDGANWTDLHIPPELKEKEFTGLRP